MKSYLKLSIAVFLLLTAVLIGANLIFNNIDKGDTSRPYRVEAQRIANKIENGEGYNLDDYPTITKVEKLTDGFSSGDRDYLVKEIDGTLYRFDYCYQNDNSTVILVFNSFYCMAALVVLGLLLFIYIKIIRPFEKIRDYPVRLAKGNLTVPLKENREKYFGKFLWGLDLLREKLGSQKLSQLALQKQNKTMVLSLSHDIKTPLSVIELYSKALEKDLYSDEQKKKEIAVSINSKCEEIRSYVDGIVKTVGEDFLELEVEAGEFYFSELIKRIKDFYADKLNHLKIDFSIDNFCDCILSGDLERSVEVLQNIIENAIKYGDGKLIALTFSDEDDCRLIHISNSGCTLNDSEVPHIFESFWRGSNVGTNSGSGLGLYICRTLMRKMDGDVYAEIRGNTITVTAVFPRV
ncbi:sensor histidine kinase [Oscillospiraceae bacterium LCP25S3_E3]